MDKKNTLLLTVIAIATLLVAVVGATFAYFTAQTGTGQSAKINVTTSTSDSVSFGSFDSIVLNANQQNFYQGAGSHQGSTTGAVVLQANNDTSATYCYTTDLIVKANDLGYTTEGNTAELILSIQKNDVEIAALTGYNKITDLTDHKICTNPGVANTDGKLPGDEGYAGPCSTTETKTVSGFDITQIAEGTISIAGTKTAGTASIHEITAAKGEKVQDKWSATATLVNLDSDQQQNTNKQFTANLKFTPVNCETGVATTPEVQP